MTFFQNIIRSGIIKTEEYQEKRSIVLTNYISLILLAAILIIIIYRYLVLNDNSLNSIVSIRVWVIGVLLLISPILLNKFLFTTASRLTLCFTPVAFVWFAFISSMLKMETIEPSVYDGLRIYLLAVSFIPYLLFNTHKLSYLIMGVVPTLVSFIFFEHILTFAGVGAELFELNTGDYQLMQIRTVVTYIIISSGCYTFQSIITQNDKFNQRLLAELKNKTEEIEAQNDELVQSQLKLNEMNQHLEELVERKTHDIKKQNEVLIKYSYTNAHHVRGPVARILGLIQLSRIKTDLNYPWFFEKVEQETNQIDEIIKRISKDLNDVNNTQESDT